MASIAMQVAMAATAFAIGTSGWVLDMLTSPTLWWSAATVAALGWVFAFVCAMDDGL